MNLKCFDINIILAISTFPTVITIKTTRATQRTTRAYFNKVSFYSVSPNSITDSRLFASFFKTDI